jgi:2-oxoglutarate dehydrogenase E1 component
MRKLRKPLVVFTPKSLLRHPAATSSLDEFTEGTFQRVVADVRENPQDTKKVFLCSGKIYYELAQMRAEKKREDVAIVRVEQLYPLHDAELAAALEGVPDGTRALWVQDEPENMGAWRFIRARFGERLLGRFPLGSVCREESASPATGSPGAHRIEHQRLMDQAFAD